MADRVHFDGSFNPPQLNGAVEVEDMGATRSRLFRANYMGLASAFYASDEDYSIVGPYGTPMYNCPLVETSPAKDVSGGVVEFTRTYAQIPPTRVEFEGYGYSYQFADIGAGTIYELPLSVRSRLVYTYYFTKTPEAIPLVHAFRIAKVADSFFFVGTAPEDGDTELLGEDDKLTRWRGNIWEHVARWVPILTPAELT